MRSSHRIYKRFQRTNQPNALVMCRHTCEDNVPCTEDLGDPLGLGKVDLDGWVHGGLVIRLDSRSPEACVELLARQALCRGQPCLVVHQNHSATLRIPCSVCDGSRTGCADMRLENRHYIPVILLIQNARDMKHSVLEDLDGNLLAKKSPISIAHDNHCD